MNVKVYVKKDYEENHASKTAKKQSQTNPIPVSPQHCWGLKPKLKKQSQLYRIAYYMVRIAQNDLKKQSQFWASQNEFKRFNNRELRQYLLYWRTLKTKPNKADMMVHSSLFIVHGKNKQRLFEKTNPISVSPNHCYEFEDEFEKTKPIYVGVN